MARLIQTPSGAARGRELLFAGFAQGGKVNIGIDANDKICARHRRKIFGISGILVRGRTNFELMLRFQRSFAIQ